jgi:hypothetical protein
VDAPSSYRRLARAALRSDGAELWLRVETHPGQPAPAPLALTVVSEGGRASWQLPDDLPGRCALDRCLEARLPIAPGKVLLALDVEGERLPVEGFWQLDFVEVDEA